MLRPLMFAAVSVAFAACASAQTPSDGALHLEHKVPSLGWSTPEDRRALTSAETAVTLLPASADPAPPPAPPERSRRRSRAAAGAIAVALAAVLGVGGYLGWPRALTAKDASASSSAMPTASAAPAESLGPASALSLAPSPRAAEPPAPASASPTTGHVRRPSRRVASPAVTATTSARPPANDCNPSYTLDENGVKRFKPWCI